MNRAAIEQRLVNDETGTDAELRADFITAGKMSEAEADFYVAQRNAALRDPVKFKLVTFPN